MSNKMMGDQLGQAESIYELAQTAHDVSRATDTLQLITDGLWQFGKLKNPSDEQNQQRQKLVEAIDIIKVKHELLGTFDDATPEQRKTFVMSLVFANNEKLKLEEKDAKKKPSITRLEPEPSLS